MKTLFSICALSLCFGIMGQSYVEIKGAITAESTNEPIAAQLFYEHLPYGDEVGRLEIGNDTGEFSFFLRTGEKYSIRVESEGYFPYAETYTVPATDEDAIEKSIQLSQGGIGSVDRLENLNFAQGSAEINESSHQELDQLADVLKGSPSMVIQLEGHTDYQGSATGNMRLSQLRVEAVKAYLVNKGIDPDRVKTKAFGGTQPLSREGTAEAHASNRRVEVRILSL